jgi:eukaryotic-like serine/threonine-protein kinase
VSFRGRSRRALPYLIAAAGGFLIAYLIVAFVIFPADIIPDDAVVPNVVNMAYDDASRTLAKAGFKAERGESRFHASAPGRTVLQQEPAAGSREKTGTVVVLHISSGQRTATVPSVLGNTRQQAQIAIENAGLEMGRLEMQHSDRPAGVVIDVQPKPGEKLTLPARVDLVVSRGPAVSEVPNLIGQTLPQARTRLQTMGLLVGAVEIDTLSIEVANTVTAQEPQPGQVISSGTLVKLIISGRRR